jgi:hypothetical protein
VMQVRASRGKLRALLSSAEITLTTLCIQLVVQ